MRMVRRLCLYACLLGGLTVVSLPIASAAGVHERQPRARASSPDQLVWSDEFNGPAGASPDTTKWTFDRGGGGWGNNELEYYTSRPTNVALDGQGHLAITARREPYSGHGVTREYTSARLQTLGLFATTYGQIDARIKLPAGRGLWPAFWAVGSNVENIGWPNAGEIDIMESLGNEPFTLYGSIHGPELGAPTGYKFTTPHRSASSLAGGFHTYGIEWSPGAIVFTFEGIPYATRTPASLPSGGRWVFDKPFFLLLNLAVGGNWPGAPNASTPFPATMLVDWVRVYS
jgi:beta-glucanase (GH16 family)